MTALKQLLIKKLTKKELTIFRGSFDVIGTIALVEIPHTLEKKEKIIATAIHALNPHIKTVAKKVGAHKGIYRRQKISIISGEKTKITEHKESGILMRLDVERCYFSPRLASERLRIASLIHLKEKVLVLFSGVGPYPLVLAKHSQAQKITGIELNPIAHAFGQENVRINKFMEKIELIQGDVRTIVPTLKTKFDRIIMPLPKKGQLFLDLVLPHIKKNGTIHLYQFAPEDEFETCAEYITNTGKKYRKNLNVMRIIKAGQHAPRVYRICLDILVN